MNRGSLHTTSGASIVCVCGCGCLGTNRGRGLIDACHRREREAGTLERFPCRPAGRRVGSRTSSLVDDALALRRRHGIPERRNPDVGWTWRRIAAELGVTFAALDKARERVGYPDLGRPARSPVPTVRRTTP